MIRVHRLDGSEFWLNAEWVEQIDSTPDTVITLTTGNNIVVRESAAAVVDLIMDYRRRILAQRRDPVASEAPR